PTPFLWAMILYLDAGDPDRRHRLAMTPVPAVVLAALELHHEDLRAFALGDHLARHPGAPQRLPFDPDLAVLVGQQHLVELDGAAPRLSKALDLDDLTWTHSILLAARRDHSFHVALTRFRDSLSTSSRSPRTSAGFNCEPP